MVWVVRFFRATESTLRCLPSLLSLLSSFEEVDVVEVEEEEEEEKAPFKNMSSEATASPSDRPMYSPVGL
jgi:hypothetical protein